jgi:MFS family permease
MESGRRRIRLPRFRGSIHPDEAEQDSATIQMATPQTGGTGAATPPLAPGRFSSSTRAFQHRNYRLFYMGQSISLIGTWMQTVAQAWLVLELTNSEAALGVVTMLQFLPIMLLVLFAGVVADRVNKRDFLILTQTVAMVQALILATLVLTDTVQLWHVYVLALMLGLANAFDMPTRQAFAIEMVGRNDLMNAVALNSGMFNGARLIGPAIGGFIISVLGVEAVFLFNGFSFIPVLLSLFLIRKRDLYTSDRKRSQGNPLKELREGITYAWRTPSIRLIIILVAMIGTFGYNFTVMLPLLAKFVLGEGSVALGFLTAAVGFGALVSALALAGRKAATRYSLFAGATAFTVLLGAVAASTNIYLTLACLIGVGASSTIFATTANTSIQLAAPDHLRARVVSLYMLLFAGSTPIGGLLMGLLASNLSTQWAIAIFAGLCAVGTAAGGLYYVTHKSAVVRTETAPVPATT